MQLTVLVINHFLTPYQVYLGALKYVPHAVYKLLENMPMPWEQVITAQNYFLLLPISPAFAQHRSNKFYIRIIAENHCVTEISFPFSNLHLILGKECKSSVPHNWSDQFCE
jgi:PRO8NT (NUC069), PrP8 N-terminal domain